MIDVYLSRFDKGFGYSQSFLHPGILNSKTELDLIKSKIKVGEQPWKSAFEKLENSNYASLNYAENLFQL